MNKLPCDCNCEVVMKDLGINKNEMLKKKLQHSRKKTNLFMVLLIVSWVRNEFKLAGVVDTWFLTTLLNLVISVVMV